MIVVFTETCVPKNPLHAAFPIYQEGIGYEVGVSIRADDAAKYIADGRAVAVEDITSSTENLTKKKKV